MGILARIILCLVTLELWLPDMYSFVVFLLWQKTNLTIFKRNCFTLVLRILITIIPAAVLSRQQNIYVLNERVTKPDASDHHDFTIKYRVTELVTDFQSRQLKFQCGNKYVAELARHPPFPSFDTKVWIILVTSFVPHFLTFLLYIICRNVK